MNTNTNTPDVVADLAALVARRAHSVRGGSPSSFDIANSAIDYLLRHGLAGSPLRASTVAPQAVPDAQPLFWYRPRSDEGYEGPIHDSSIESVRKESGGWVPLFTGAPVATKPYNLDADPAGIRALTVDATAGAIAFGALDMNRAPAGHWLASFWQMGHDAAQPTTQPADAQDAARLDWLLPIVGGDDSADVNARTLALGLQIMAGRTGREAIDAARTLQSGGA